VERKQHVAKVMIRQKPKNVVPKRLLPAQRKKNLKSKHLL
jgi:hypothetical protein